MKSPESNEPLSRALADWRVQPARNPGFRAAVWARIEAAGVPASWTDYARRHAAMVTGALLVALVLGGWAGREQARSQVAAERAEIADLYVQSLDAREMSMP
ncbi:MAG TPA: hypothetical protein VNR00_10930 [Opitutus sp.]|nr:hypothetical protein [Opitutus sp.]